MANNVRFVDNVKVGAFGNTGGGGSSVSSSYAETASFAQSGNGNFSGSFSGSFQGDGSSLTGVTGEWDGSYSGSASITGSLTVSGSLNIQGSSSYTGGSITLDNTTVPSLPGSDTKISIGCGGSGAPQKVFQIYTNAGYVQIGPTNSSYSHFLTDRPKFYFNKPLQVSGEVMSHVDEDLVLGSRGGTSDTITIGTNDIIFELNNNNIFYMTTGSSGLDSILSGSATSTASFGTYLGNKIAFFPDLESYIEENDSKGFLIRTSDEAEIIGSDEWNIHSPNGASASIIDNIVLTPEASSQVIIDGDAVITGSLVISGSSKPLEVIGSGSTVFSIVGSLGELFAIDDQLSGSLLVVNDASGIPQFEVFSDGRTLIGADPRSLYTTATISSTTSATSQSIYSLSTSSYDGVFFDYTVTSASNARAGNIMSIWNSGSIVYTENTTTDIGSTTGVNFDVIISQSQAQLISVTDTAGWKIKTTIRSI